MRLNENFMNNQNSNQQYNYQRYIQGNGFHLQGSDQTDCNPLITKRTYQCITEEKCEIHIIGGGIQSRQI
jgi:hypothetical protein